MRKHRSFELQAIAASSDCKTYETIVVIQNPRAQSLNDCARLVFIQCFKRRRFLNLACLLVMPLVLWYLWPSPELPYIDPATLYWNFPVANFTASNAKRALFLLSMGQEASESTIVERCLLSIRRRGLYLGPVIVLTDAPHTRYRSLAGVDPNLVLLKPPSQDWRWNLSEDMPYKRFKTYSLDYLQLDDRLKNVELVYYLDVDIVVGRPLRFWFDHVERTYLSDYGTHHPSQMIFFKGNYPWRPLQGGQFLVERKSSQPCLERWRYHIDSHPDDPKDQSALTLILKEQNTTDSICHLTIMPQQPYLQFLDKTSMKKISRSQDYPTLMHIKNTEDADWIPNRIQSRFFRQLLYLSPEEERVIGKAQIHPSKSWSFSSAKQEEEENTR